MLLAVAGPGATRPDFPALTGRVVDVANVIPADREARLTARLAAFEARTRHQLVVVTVRSLSGQAVDLYTLTLANRWGIGRRGIDDGVVLLVAPIDRKVRIEVGRGLERTLTNARAAAILATDVLPRFRTGDMPGGIDAGVAAIIATLEVR